MIPNEDTHSRSTMNETWRQLGLERGDGPINQSTNQPVNKYFSFESSFCKSLHKTIDNFVYLFVNKCH